MKYEDIIIRDRYRKDMGDIQSLARSISTVGLLHPPIVDSNGVLIDGERRIRAMREMGWEEIPVRIVEVPSLLIAENDANEMAKQWTVSERVAIARAIEEELAGRVGNPNFNSGNISLIAQGQSRDIAADKSGLGSGKTYEAAKRVVDSGTEEVIEAMDSGEVSINLASRFIALPEEEKESARHAIEEEGATVKEAVKEAVRNHRTLGTGENEWYTPSEYIEMARLVMNGIDLDPASSEAANATVKASRIFTAEDDGLTKDWSGKVWMNPPYSRDLMPAFVEKLSQSFIDGQIESAVMLSHNNTDTRWFHRISEVASAICFPKTRIRFYRGDEIAAPTNGQAFFYLGNNPELFAEKFSEIGLVVTPWKKR